MTIDFPTQKCSNRLAGDTRYETAVAISNEGWTTSDKVILARGDLFPDALAGATLAAKYNAPILLTNPEFLYPATKKEILRLRIKDIYILGTGDAISGQVVSDLVYKCFIDTGRIHRFGGETRYETCRDIVNWSLSLGMTLDVIPVSYGENFPDALALGPFVGRFKGPLLLSRDKFIPDSIKNYISDNKSSIKMVFIAGGPDVVSEDVKGDIAKILGI